MHFTFTLSITDITIGNSDSFNDAIVAKGQESGPSKKQVGYRTGPLLRYSFSMSHSCIAYLHGQSSAVREIIACISLIK